MLLLRTCKSRTGLPKVNGNARQVNRPVVNHLSAWRPPSSFIHTSQPVQAPLARPKKKIFRPATVVKKKPSNNPTFGFTQAKIDKGKNLYKVASSYFGIHPTTFADVDEMNLTNKEWRNSGFSVEVINLIFSSLLNFILTYQQDLLTSNYKPR